ncbi:uncharacterized protein M6B38_367145 [Iris pallida]|uniref:Uncharacterized protein n=1 Tax=Iris pallida TaxID=29817 RepID=A0AAX6GH91_IRIPA|nr:uncharacterized protein M6B38_367145 [Iris pallida]
MKKPTAAAAAPHLPPDPTRNPNPSQKHRRIRSPRVRLRRPSSGGRRSGGGAITPLLKWKLSDPDPENGSSSAPGSDKDPPHAAAAAVSARKLAAGIWMGFEPNVYDQPSSLLHTNTALHAPNLLNNPRSGTLQKHQTSEAFPNPSMERATKWDPGFYGRLKLLEDKQAPSVSKVSTLQSELEQARSRITELENERQSSKKQLDHFLRKLAEEKESWRRREHEKIRAVIDSIKDDLRRERKNRQRLEIVNSKIVNELAEAKMSAKRFLQDYEKEKKARELMEEVCDELAKEIGEDKAEVEALKAESMRSREEVDEERKMLQMAEVWREERVQMKLVDAKLTLEDKYSQMVKLQSEIEAFLKAKGDLNPDAEEKRRAESLKEAADAVMVREIEFSYQPPPASEDIFSVFEELQPREGSNEREIEACFANGNGMIDGHGNTDDDSGWETVSRVEEQGSSNSLDGSDPSVNNGIREESNASVSGTDWDENGDNGKVNSEISEVFSSTTRQSKKKKGSSVTRLWRSSCPNNGEVYKKHVFETVSPPDMKSGEAGLSSPSVGQWSSPDSVDRRIDRGMKKGCIEWPRGAQKYSLKAKLLEARMESQKVQLRQALKQKI